MNLLLKSIVSIYVITFISCQDKNAPIDSLSSVQFNEPVVVTVDGYESNIMEPFLSRDGTVLFFNNLNSPTVNTNLHWATRIDQTRFEYQGELDEINTESLEGVPTMDVHRNFYFVSTVSYNQTLSTIYRSAFSNGNVSNGELVEHISRLTPGWVNFDVEVSSDGQTLYFVDGLFDEAGGPYEANLVIARKEGNLFSRSDASPEIFQNINTQNLEYAAALSQNELEICFTRVTAPPNNESEPRLYWSTRNNTHEPFSNPILLENIDGFVEGATFDSEDRGIYFHKKENEVFRLYYAAR